MSSIVSLRMTLAIPLFAHTAPGSSPGPYPTSWAPGSGDGLKSLRELAGMTLLGAGERLEPLSDLVEVLVTRGAGEPGVHLGVLVGLAGDRRLQVVGRRADGHTGHRVADLRQEVEVTERVSRLTFGHRAEQGGDIGVALNVGLLREVEVTTVRLALSRERLFEVVVGLGAVQIGHA